MKEILFVYRELAECTNIFSWDTKMHHHKVYLIDACTWILVFHEHAERTFSQNIFLADESRNSLARTTNLILEGDAFRANMYVTTVPLIHATKLYERDCEPLELGYT